MYACAYRFFNASSERATDLWLQKDEGTGVTSDVVKVKDEEPATPGPPI